MLMKYSLLIIIALFSVFSLQLKAQEQYISVNATSLSFSDYIQELSNKSALRIYYQAKYFANTKVSLKADSIPILQAVQKGVASDSFQVVFWNEAIVVVKGHNYPTKLADYKFVKPKVVEEVKEEESQKQQRQYINTSQAGATKKIYIGKKANAKGKTSVDITGLILNSYDKVPLPGATVYIVEVKKGASSNASGKVYLKLRPGRYTMRVLFMGMKTQKFQLIVYSKGSFTVKMEDEGIDLSAVNVYGDRQMNMRQRDAGLEKMTTKVLKSLPVMAGEPDLVKASSMLPGIVSVGEGSSGLSVRGGSSDQNAFYINDIPVFNTSHVFGFFPAFNADLINNFTIYKGYIPSSYGGRLSSVFDIETRKGNRRKFSLHGGISPMAANFVLSTPIIKDTLSVIASARTSYSDWILRKIKDPLINTSSAKFTDLSLGVYYDLPKMHLAVFAYHSQDYFAYSTLNDYNYSNDGFSINLKQLFTDKFRARYSIAVAEYNFETNDYQEISKAYHHPYTVMQNEARAGFEYNFSNMNLFEFGYHLTYYGLNRGVVSPIDKSVRSVVDLGKEKGIENALYISDRWQLLDWFEINAGARFSLYNALGPATVYTYIDGQTIDDSYLQDTITYANNQVITTHFFPELRFSAKIDVDNYSSFKIAYTQMHQNLFMLNTTASIAPSSQWKLADYHTNPSKSNQYSLGYFRNFIKQGFETSVEGFYKNTSDYTEFKDGADFLNTNKVELSLLQGRQWSYGLELMLRRRGEFRFTGWIAYTYSRAWVQVDANEPWQQINKGKKYPASFDIPHSLSAFLNIKLSKRLSFSTTVNYQTGRPMTFPISIYYVNGIPYVDYSERNEYRIPDYFRMDASLTLDGSLKRKKLIHSQYVFSVYNITGRDNPYSVYFNVSNSGVTAYQYSVISVPVMSLSWIFKLGNYDAE
jgi:hypothetical protein